VFPSFYNELKISRKKCFNWTCSIVSFYILTLHPFQYLVRVVWYLFQDSNNDIWLLQLFFCIDRVLENYRSLRDPLLAHYLKKQRVFRHLHKACLVCWPWLCMHFQHHQLTVMVTTPSLQAQNLPIPQILPTIDRWYLTHQTAFTESLKCFWILFAH